MKRIFLIGFLSVLFAVGVAYADQSSVAIPGTGGGQAPNTFTGIVEMQGKPGPSVSVTVDNTADLLRILVVAAGGSWLGGLDGKLQPISVLLTCDTTATRWCFGGTVPTASTGHALPADGSWRWGGREMLSTMRGISTTNDNVTCAVTLGY